MIQNLLATFRVDLRSVVTTVICAAVAASAASVATLFIAVAIFIWTSDNYGRLQASIAMAAFFIIVAAIAVTVLLVAQNKSRKGEAGKGRSRQERSPGLARSRADPDIAAFRHQGAADRHAPSRPADRAGKLGRGRLGPAARARRAGRQRSRGGGAAGGIVWNS